MKHLKIDSFSALLFDLDGTLADTMPLHNKAWIETLKDHGYEMTYEILSEYAGVPTFKTVELFNERFNWNLEPHTILKHKEEKAAEGMKSVTTIHSTLEVVKHYHGVKPMAIVSGGMRVNVEALLRKLNLHDYFSVFVGADSTEKGKPHPDPFLLAAKLLNVDPKKCLVFEDGMAGIKGAQSCGMSVVHVGPDFSLKALYEI